MKGMITLVLLVALNFQLSARDKFVSGEGRFVSADGDSLTFIKKQLTYSAFRDVISKELSAMGHNSEVFWSKYHEKFDSYFSPIKEKLSKAYGATEESPLEGSKKESYDKALRSKKLAIKARYGKLQKVISSYSVKKMSRSPQFPNSRYMSVQAKVNRKLLNDVFYSFTRGGTKRSYKNLFVSVEYFLKDMSWNDVGVEVESDFTNVLSEHWKRWFEDKFKGKISNVVLATESDVEKLALHIKMPSDASSHINDLGGVKNDLENSQENTIITVEDELQDSLWLKVRVNVEKLSEDIIFKKRSFNFGGEFLLFDLKTNRLASHYDFISEEATFETIDNQKLSSNLASLIYRLPISKWQGLIKDIAHFPLGQKSFSLEVLGASSVKQIDEVNTHLSTLGLTNNLKIKLESFNRDRALVKIYFKGDIEELKSTILKSKNMEIDKRKLIQFQNDENPFVLNLIEKPIVEKTTTSNGQG
jgi:hypothetical protein